MRILIIVSLMLICCCGRGSLSAQVGVRGRALAHVLVYKTKSDYRNYVTVELSSDKNTVVSYPDPADLKTGSGYPLPVLLHKGYLLDRRGVSRNTAYIKMTYKEYADLKALPTPEQLYKLIIDKHPFKELYDCGVRNPEKNSEARLNDVIDHHLLGKTFAAVK